MKNFIKILIILAFSQTLWAAGITFTFANVTYSGSSPTYFEFDVMAQADVAGTKLGDNLIYINYNTLGFGTSVVSSGKVTVSKGSLLQGGSAPFFYYTIINSTDNTNSRMAITSGYNYPDSPEFGNDLPTTPTQLLHISMEIADDTQMAGLSFEPSLMKGQQYESDNSTKYDPVVATDTENASLNPSGLDELVSNEIPTRYKLYDNFPNPFNPSTTLKFDIPEIVENMELAIYDVLGRKVTTLYDGNLNPGTYQYIWDGLASSGMQMPTGVYFAVLKARQFTQTIKMMMIK